MEKFSKLRPKNEFDEPEDDIKYEDEKYLEKYYTIE